MKDTRLVHHHTAAFTLLMARLYHCNDGIYPPKEVTPLLISVLQGSSQYTLLTKNNVLLLSHHTSWLHSALFFDWEFPCPALDLQLTGDHLCGKPSAIGQPTRPTQPFILSGSINEQYSAINVCDHNQWQYHLMNTYEVEARIVLFGG